MLSGRSLLSLSESEALSRLMQQWESTRLCFSSVSCSAAAAPSESPVSPLLHCCHSISLSSSLSLCVCEWGCWSSRAPHTLPDFAAASRCRSLMETTTSLCEWENSYTRTRVQNPLCCPVFPSSLLLMLYHWYISRANHFHSQTHIFTIAKQNRKKIHQNKHNDDDDDLSQYCPPFLTHACAFFPCSS